MRSRAAGQLRREKAEHIAAVTFDMDHLRAEFGQLRADIGLRDKHASADRADTFKGAERRDDTRGRRALQAFDPFRYGLLQFFDFVFGCDEPRIVRHVYWLPLECPSAPVRLACFCYVRKYSLLAN